MPAIVGLVCAPLVRAWMRTLRVRVLYPDGGCDACARETHRAEVVAVSERDLLAGLTEAVRYRCAVLIAHGRDGDKADALARRLGLDTLRGSSRSGGADAARQFRRRTDAARPAIMPVDGPLGPAGVAKAGVFTWASVTGRTVRPLACAAWPRLRFPFTWSGIYMPVPFARVVLVFGPGMPPAATRESRAAAAAELTRILHALRARAEQAVRKEPSWWRGADAPAAAEARPR